MKTSASSIRRTAPHSWQHVKALLRPASRSSSQSSRKSGGSEGDDPTKPDFRDVTVQLLTHADESAEFIVYKAVVTAAFLRRFSTPLAFNSTKSREER